MDVDASDWYDYWHYHPDWPGYGNINWRMRARHLEALALVFNRFVQQLNPFEKPYQLWIYLDRHDSSQDAVYVHSPNPNRDDFPLVITDAQWGITEVSQYFERMLPGYRLRAGSLGDSHGYFVYCPGVGITPEGKA